MNRFERDNQKLDSFFLFFFFFYKVTFITLCQ